MISSSQEVVRYLILQARIDLKSAMSRRNPNITLEVTRNQFHVLEIEVPSRKGGDQEIRGHGNQATQKQQ